MQPTKKDLDLSVKYFEMEDPLEEKKEGDSSLLDSDTVQAYCQFETSLDRATYDALKTESMAELKPKRKDVLLLYIDKSGSMYEDFEDLQKAMRSMADILFDEETGEKKFEDVHVAYHTTHIDKPEVKNTKEEYLKKVNDQRVEAAENFKDCFEHMEVEVAKYPDDTCFHAVFFSDGQDTMNPDEILYPALEKLKKFLKERESNHNQPSVIYSLGFGENHDARLLNGVTQAGSEQGNFTYVRTQGDTHGNIVDKLKENLAMALNASSNRLVITHPDRKGFKITKPVRSDYILAEEVKDEKNQDEVVVPGEDSAWMTVNFSSVNTVRKNDLLGGKLVMTLHLGNDMQIICKPRVEVMADPSDELRIQALFEHINRLTFELIQRLQTSKTKEGRQEALDQLIKIDNSLNKHQQNLKTVTDRKLKRKFGSLFLEQKMQSSRVISLLRSIQDLSHLDNQVIMQINDIGYAAIQQTQLKKMLDKRALVNEERMAKMDAEVDEILEKINIEELRKKHQAISDEIGICTLSCVDVFEAIEMGDCMCIGVEVEKPDAAIADPSRLVVKNIVPTYATSESFLQSTKFMKTQEEERGHGGYRGRGGMRAGSTTHHAENNLMKGPTGEKITGILPLYLFNQHWQLAKRKIAPVLGFMCTQDILGYTTEQLHVVPFLVLHKAMEKQAAEPSIKNQEILDMIQETCVQMIRGNKVLRKQIVQTAHDFAYQPKGKSTRTSDVVKSTKVLVLQLMCLLKIKDLSKSLEQIEEIAEIAEFFLNEQKCVALKNKLFRFTVEEQMRSYIDKDFNSFFTEVIEKYMLEDSDEFVDATFLKKKAQLEAEVSQQSSDTQKYASYEKMANELRGKFGYDDAPSPTVQKDSKDAEMSEKKIESVDFNHEIAVYLEKQKLMTGQATSFIEKLSESYDEKKVFQEIRFLAKQIFAKEFASISAMPGFCDLSAEDFKLVLLAIVTQNSGQSVNKQRVTAVKEGKYREILSGADARVYLVDQLTDKLLIQLKKREVKIVKKALSDKMEVVVDKVLTAPDVFVAAAMMQQNGMSIGRGDFHKAIIKLTTTDVVVPDLGRKLILLKTGLFLHKSQIDQPLTKLTTSDAMKLFADSGKTNLTSDENNCVSAKHVFKLWSKCVCLGKSLTQTQIENIFPEFAARLQLYDKCCDESGQAVRNLDYYKSYRASSDHSFRNRGGLKKDKAQKKAKEEFAKKREQQKKDKV